MNFFGILLVSLALMNFSEGISFDLCAYFVQGATCQSTCLFEAVHSWGISLCLHAPESTRKCCIPLSHPLLKNMKPKPTPASTTTTTTTTTTIVSLTSQDAARPANEAPSAARDAPRQAAPTCGVPSRRARVRRVVGGRGSAPDTWPWQVALQQYTGDYLCGGVILNENWILTAAHCFQSSPSQSQFVRVYAGNQKLLHDKGRRNYSRPIAKIVQHPDFQANVESISTDPVTGRKLRYTRHLHDLALVELETSLEFSATIKPVCLPEVADETSHEKTTAGSGTCWVAGWGKGGQGHSTDDLQEVSGRTIDYTECGKKWGTNFTDDVICFGDKGNGPCKGDSGSGMFCRRHDDGCFYVSGIVSWGRDDCDHGEHPSVLMNVASYRTWIDHVINP